MFSQCILGADRSRRLLVEEYVSAAPGERILDVGCGPGYVAEYFHGSEYIGFDTNPSCIDYARRRYGHMGSFFCHELDEVTAAKLKPFDVIIMAGLLHHLEDKAALELLHRARRLTKRGGCVITLDGCYVKGQPLIAKKLLDWDRGRYIRGEEGYKALASRAFDYVVSHIRHDMMRIPYSLIIMQMSQK